MEFLELVGRWIKNRIAEGGYDTVEQFAFEKDVRKSTLSEIINGKNDPKLTTLAKIASNLGLTLSELFHDPDINTWVREKAPGYNPRTPKAKPAKSAKKAALSKRR